MDKERKVTGQLLTSSLLELIPVGAQKRSLPYGTVRIRRSSTGKNEERERRRMRE